MSRKSWLLTGAVLSAVSAINFIFYLIVAATGPLQVLVILALIGLALALTAKSLYLALTDDLGRSRRGR